MRPRTFYPNYSTVCVCACQVINFYMQLIYERSKTAATTTTGKCPLKEGSLPRTAVMSTFFYAKLTAVRSGGYGSVRRWSRQMRLLEQDLVLVPIHDRGMHWCLAVSGRTVVLLVDCADCGFEQ